jgi:tripartite-type tricarboxylate transporter receptor subunit TctC
MGEAGQPGVEAESWFGLVVSNRTSPPVVARLQSALRAAQSDPAYTQSLEKQGATAGDIGPESFGQLIQRDVVKWAEIVKKANIKLE